VIISFDSPEGMTKSEFLEALDIVNEMVKEHESDLFIDKFDPTRTLN